VQYKKKVCLIGDFSVGKTSLVQSYVNQAFSEKYLTTIGVKIDTKMIELGDDELKLVLWDVAGRDSLSSINTSYLIGAAGIILVIDGTRKETILGAESLLNSVLENTKKIPHIVFVNKNDLKNEWEFDEDDAKNFESLGWNVFVTSAKTGEGVEEAFIELAKELVSDS